MNPSDVSILGHLRKADIDAMIDNIQAQMKSKYAPMTYEERVILLKKLLKAVVTTMDEMCSVLSEDTGRSGNLVYM
jgi:acyl-CoA reductase-like NAD-dependent aldehyde dehydrogenase